MDLDKLYAPAAPDDELRGPAQAGAGTLPTNVHQSTSDESSIPRAQDGLQTNRFSIWSRNT